MNQQTVDVAEQHTFNDDFIKRCVKRVLRYTRNNKLTEHTNHPSHILEKTAVLQAVGLVKSE